MSIGDGVGFVIFSIVLGGLLWIGIKATGKFYRAFYPRDFGVEHGGKRNRENYNMDTRRFILEKMRRPIWRRWLFAGFTVSFVSLLFVLDSPIEDKIGTVLGFMVSWLLIMIAVSGTIMTGSSAPNRQFLRKYKLSTMGSFQEDLLPRIRKNFRSTRFFSDAIVPKMQYNASVMIANKQLTTGATLNLFRYRFEFKPTKLTSQQLYEYSVLILDFRMPVPELTIYNQNVYDFKYFVPKRMHEKISLEGRFGTKYDLFIEHGEGSENRLAALSLMTPDTMQIFEDHFSNSCIIIENQMLLLATRDDLFDGKNYQVFYEGIDLLIQKMFHKNAVRKDLGKLLKP